MKYQYFRSAVFAAVILFCGGSTITSAQTLLGGLAFGSDGGDLGIRLGVYLPVVGKASVGGDFTYFFPRNSLDIYAFNANGPR